MAHHDRKRSVAAAASLFGASDTAPIDFFSDIQERPEENHSVDTANTAADTSGLFSSSETFSNDLGWNNTASEWDQQQNGAEVYGHAGVAQDLFSGDGQTGDAYSSQSAYNGYDQQWPDYTPSETQQQQNWSEASYAEHNNYANSTGYEYYQNDGYEPAAPAVTASSTQFQSTPDPYAPTQTSSTAYTPSYDPYAPPPATTAKPPPASRVESHNAYVGYAYSTPQPDVSTKSAQESASATTYRPTKPNAYDPPVLPDTSRSKKHHVRPAPPIVSPYGPAATQAPPPPPPTNVYGAHRAPSPATYGRQSAVPVSAVPPTQRSYVQPTSVPSQQSYGGSAYDPYAPAHIQPQVPVAQPNGTYDPYAPSVVSQPLQQPSYSHQDTYSHGNYTSQTMPQSHHHDGYANTENGTPYHSIAATEGDWYHDEHAGQVESSYSSNSQHSYEQPASHAVLEATEPAPTATSAVFDEEDIFGSNIPSEQDDWYKDSTSPPVNATFSPKSVDLGSRSGTPAAPSGMVTPPANQYSPSKTRQASYPSPKGAAGTASAYQPSKQSPQPVSGSGSLPSSPTRYRSFSAHASTAPPASASMTSTATSPYPPPPPVGARGIHARAGTPGSLKNGRVASPDVVGRRPSSAARASPRPDAYIPNGVSARTSSPAAHLEAARNRFASPEATMKSIASPSYGIQLPLGNSAPLDIYKPVNAAHVPIPPSPMEPPKYGPAGESGLYMSPNLYSSSLRTTPPPVPDSASMNGPYAPKTASSNRRQGSLASNYSAEYPAPSTTSTYSPYGLTTGTTSAYAPSISQTADGDLLGRMSARIPLVAFGFGGKMISCFHTQLDTVAGFDVSLASRKSSPIIIRDLKDAITSDFADPTSPSFPGPLFSDPGSPTVNLARTAASTTKAKKVLVVKYLEERSVEIERGLAHMNDVERPRGDAKLALVQLLKILTENDGKLSGTPEIDSAVRAVLLPRLQPDISADAFGFSAPPIDSIGMQGELGYGALPSDRADSTIASYTVTSSSLDKIQNLILRGERRNAYRYALDQRMWAHAMLISSSVDKEAWKEVANEFIKTELGIDAGKSDDTVTNGRECLRVGYSLFAGNGANAMQELMPPKALSRPAGSSGSLVIPAPTTGFQGTPLSANPPLPHQSLATNGVVPPLQALSKWREVATIIVSNSTAGDVAALTALGDYLAGSKWIEAAHVCYLLSHQSSYFGGSSTSRMALLGSEGPMLKPSFHTNVDALIFSEILEFALSLTPVVKGQEPFVGLPHLQPYRLLRATQLAEIGDITLANRYCEAIGTTLRQGKASPYYTNTFLQQLKELSDRITAVPHLDKSGSWIARKMTKSSLEGVGSWLEGRLTKFIAGEGEEGDPRKIKDGSKVKPDTSAGPFAQFSVISSANTSPTASTTNLATTLQPPIRSGSAVPLRGPFGASNPQIDRASSAMDVRPHTSAAMQEAPQILSAGPTTTSFYSPGPAAYSPFMQNSNVGHTKVPSVELTSPRTVSPKNDLPESPVKEEAPSWGVSYSAPDDASGPTPTAATFYSVGSNADTGFLSPMDTFSALSPMGGSSTPTPRSVSAAAILQTTDEDDDDLGLGNRGAQKKLGAQNQNGSSSPSSPTTPVGAAPPAAKPGPTPAQKPADAKAGGSWFGRLWGRSSDGPGPVKASLGEETTFYYDKELKKWVNKKAGDDTTATSTPPPPPPSRGPSRPQSAAPGATSTNGAGENPRGDTPPPRPSSTAMGNSAPPPPTLSALKNVPPKRSHLAESFVPSPEGVTPPPRPATTTGAESTFSGGSMDIPSTMTPPPAGGRSSAAKRKGKSRYVDVFQQEQGGAN